MSYLFQKNMRLWFFLVMLYFCYSSLNVYAGSASDTGELSESLRDVIGEIETLKKQNEELSREITFLKESIKEIKVDVEAKKNAEVIIQKSPDEIIKMAEGFMNQNNVDEARRLLNLFVEKNPKHIYCGLMLFHVGNSYFVEKDYKNAAIQYMNSFKKNANGSKSSEVLYKLALCFKQLLKTKECKSTLNKLIQDYPNDAAIIRKAKAELAKIDAAKT